MVLVVYSLPVKTGAAMCIADITSVSQTVEDYQAAATVECSFGPLKASSVLGHLEP